jgi:hypothetical protein
VVPGTRLQLRDFYDSVRFSGSAKREPGGRIGKTARYAGRLLFNNMVVLSRAFWVQDDYECDCDDHAIFRNEHRKRVSEANIDRRVYDCWC